MFRSVYFQESSMPSHFSVPIPNPQRSPHTTASMAEKLLLGIRIL